MTKRKTKIEINDTVYIKGATKFQKWTYLGEIEENGKKLARCHSVIVKGDGQANEEIIETFAPNELTKEPPYFPPSGIYMG